MKKDYKVIVLAMLLSWLFIAAILRATSSRVIYGPYYDKDMNLVEFNIETGEWYKVDYLLDDAQ